MLPSNLPYLVSALEPVISAKSLANHQALFEGYAAGYAAASEASAHAFEPAQMRAASQDLAFQGSGYLLHSIFFNCMARPADAGFPLAETGRQLAARFGSADDFKRLFTAAAMGIQGPGWAILAYQHATRSLEILSVLRHSDNWLALARPVLVLDVWEHAYYPDYGRDRAAYVNAWWRLVNGAYVERAIKHMFDISQPV